MTESLIGLAIENSLFSYGLMAVIALLTAVMIRIIVGLLARARGKQVAASPVVVSVTPARDESAAVAAAIAAAVYTMIGAHRLVYLGEARPGIGWTSELRARLHTSHAPRLEHR
jgi:hypothetical protein